MSPPPPRHRRRCPAIRDASAYGGALLICRPLSAPFTIYWREKLLCCCCCCCWLLAAAATSASAAVATSENAAGAHAPCTSCISSPGAPPATSAVASAPVSNSFVPRQGKGGGKEPLHRDRNSIGRVRVLAQPHRVGEASGEWVDGSTIARCGVVRWVSALHVSSLLAVRALQLVPRFLAHEELLSTDKVTGWGDCTSRPRPRHGTAPSTWHFPTGTASLDKVCRDIRSWMGSMCLAPTVSPQPEGAFVWCKQTGGLVFIFTNVNR